MGRSVYILAALVFLFGVKAGEASYPDKAVRAKILPVPNLLQTGYSCGPTSLAMILKYYGFAIEDYREIFSSNAFIGHGPLSLRDRAGEFGLITEIKNHAKPDDLIRLIDRGIPPLVLINSADSNNVADPERYTAHWIVVVGYSRKGNGIACIYYNDPKEKMLQSLPVGDFIKTWKYDAIPGNDYLFVAMAPDCSPQAEFIKDNYADGLSKEFGFVLGFVYRLERSYYFAENFLGFKDTDVPVYAFRKFDGFLSDDCRLGAGGAQAAQIFILIHVFLACLWLLRLPVYLAARMIFKVIRFFKTRKTP